MLALVAVLAVFQVPSAPAQSEDTAGSDASLCEELFELPGIGPVCPRGRGMYEVYGPDGSSLGFTHGGDPACTDCDDGIGPLSGTTPACVAATPNTYYVHVIYARASDDADRYASIVPTIRKLVADANAYVDAAGQATGSGLDIRVLCDNGEVVVENLVLPTSKSSDSFSTIVSDIRALGYNDGKKKYWVWYDDNTTCGCSGTGHIYTDESPGAGNLNNGNANSMFGVNFGFVSVTTWLHELGHNLGAVQNGAPFSSLASHCIDGFDIMCYNDGGANSSGYSNSYCATRVFDCNKNTYCHASPAAGSYLATMWNVCGESQRFLQRAVGNVAPVMQQLVCSPSASEGQTVSCSFQASDPGDNLSYSVTWGDGTAPTRVPASGYAASNESQAATHVFAVAGTFTVSVNATDDRSPALTSAPRNLSLSVSAANGAPVVQSLSCTTAILQPGATASCTFSASDDSTGVRYRVEWGDGQTSLVPSASTYVAPGATLRGASHVYDDVGNYSVNVTATDDATIPLTSGARTATVRVANEAPLMRSLSCTATTLLPGDTGMCSFNATDDSAGIRYRIEWGDGQTTEIPGTGHVAPGTMRSASHVYATAANFTVRVTATDNVSTPLTSAPRTTVVRVVSDTTPPTLALTDPVDGYLYFGCGLEEAKRTAGVLFVQRGCVRAVATDANGVTRVEVRSRGQTLAQDVVAPYQLEFVVQNTELGTHYEVRAYDRSNNVRIVTFLADGIAPV